jgi:predicted transposase YbfD/YdcC
LRGTARKIADHPALHLVSVWAAQPQFSFGQLAVEEKSNEITAIPKILETLHLHGAIVTIDAAGCPKKIAEQIVDGGGDYVLAVKKNQKNLYQEIEHLFKLSLELDDLIHPIDCFQTTEYRHSRIEERTVLVLPIHPLITCGKDWPGLQSVIMVIRERTVNHKTSSSIAYFISSLKCSAEQFADYIRQQWRIENHLHWS